MKILVLVAAAAAVSLVSAKLDFGACPSPPQAAWKSSMSGTYFLQYYDSTMSYLQPVFDLLTK